MPSALGACLAQLEPASHARLADYLARVEAKAGDVIVREQAHDTDTYFVLAGRARVSKGGLEVLRVGPGDHFGELALLAGRPRGATVTALEDTQLAVLSKEAYARLVRDEPDVAIALVHALVDGLGDRLGEMTDRVNVLLQERSLPRRTSVELRVAGSVRRVPMGTAVGELLGPGDPSHPIVAALLDARLVSLDTRLTSDGVLAPVDTRHWEGERVRRSTLRLLLLAAAREVAPGAVLRIGPSYGAAFLVETAPHAADLGALAQRIEARMRELVEENAPILHEWWTVEEALEHFREEHADDAVQLLRAWRDAMVPLVRCGSVYAIAFGPVMSRVGGVGTFRVESDGDRVLLYTRDAQGDSPRRATEKSATADHDLWLRSLGLTSVGSLTQRCVGGDVAQLVRVSEGFHEKRLSRIADDICARRDRVRVVCVAGPSSSGKTTFLRRLTVQLLVNGLNPIGISLDDYYVDRESTPRDEAGELDFEAFEALDSALLQDELARVLRGETVRVARFDFKRGKSVPGGGAEIRMRDGDVLLVEGIHGLHPRLFDGRVPSEQVHRVFVCPLTGLPLDAATRIAVSDLRLLRRIVRDRHQRSMTAADTIQRWPSVRAGERKHIFPYFDQADAVFDSSLVYEPAVLKVYAERYLLEVPADHPGHPTAWRLLQLLSNFVSIYPDHVPPTSMLREFIGGSGFEY